MITTPICDISKNISTKFCISQQCTSPAFICKFCVDDQCQNLHIHNYKTETIKMSSFTSLLNQLTSATKEKQQNEIKILETACENFVSSIQQIFENEKNKIKSHYQHQLLPKKVIQCLKRFEEKKYSDLTGFDMKKIFEDLKNSNIKIKHDPSQLPSGKHQYFIELIEALKKGINDFELNRQNLKPSQNKIQKNQKCVKKTQVKQIKQQIITKQKFDKSPILTDKQTIEQIKTIKPTQVFQQKRRISKQISKQQIKPAPNKGSKQLSQSPDTAIELPTTITSSKQIQPLIQTAEDYLSHQKFKQAIVILRKVIDLDENYSMGYYLLGLAYDSIQDYQNAIENYRAAIEINPKYVQAYNNRGLIFSFLKKYLDAIEDFNKAIQISPGFVDAYFNRAILYTDLNQLDKADAQYSKVLDMEPRYKSAYINRGILYERTNRLKDALNDYSSALTIDKRYINAYKNRASLYQRMNNLELAIEDYSKLIQYSSAQKAGFYYCRANIYFRQNKLVWAVEDLNKAIARDSECSYYYILRGTCFKRLNKSAQGTADFKKAEQLGNNNKK